MLVEGGGHHICDEFSASINEGPDGVAGRIGQSDAGRQGDELHARELGGTELFGQRVLICKPWRLMAAAMASSEARYAL